MPDSKSKSSVCEPVLLKSNLRVSCQVPKRTVISWTFLLMTRAGVLKRILFHTSSTQNTLTQLQRLLSEILWEGVGGGGGGGGIWGGYDGHLYPYSGGGTFCLLFTKPHLPLRYIYRHMDIKLLCVWGGLGGGGQTRIWGGRGGGGELDKRRHFFNVTIDQNKWRKEKFRMEQMWNDWNQWHRGPAIIPYKYLAYRANLYF